jgi:YbbR domain-containing protein
LKVFTKNPILKIISLILAVILWLFVKSEKGGEVGLVVPLELYRLPANLIVTQVTAEVLNVRINGPLSQLERLSTKEVRARVDLSRAKPGLNSFDILAKNFNIPQGLKITQTSPSAIKVELDRVVDKVVRVKALVKGKPPKGSQSVIVSVDPPYINLKGAHTQLVGLKEVSTEEIDISGVKQTVKVEVPLKLTGLTLQKGGNKKVTVTIEVEGEVGW